MKLTRPTVRTKSRFDAFSVFNLFICVFIYNLIHRSKSTLDHYHVAAAFTLPPLHFPAVYLFYIDSFPAPDTKKITSYTKYFIIHILNTKCWQKERKEENRSFNKDLKSTKKCVAGKQFLWNNKVNLTQFYANFLLLFCLNIFYLCFLFEKIANSVVFISF